MQTGIKVGDCMKTTLVTIGADASVYEAAGKMKREDVGCLLVREGDGALSAIVTDADIVRKCVAERRMDARVGEIASKPLITISPQADLSEAAALMGKKGVKRLVTAADGEIKGIVSQTDIVRISPSLYDLICERAAGNH